MTREEFEDYLMKLSVLQTKIHQLNFQLDNAMHEYYSLALEAGLMAVKEGEKS